MVNGFARASLLVANAAAVTCSREPPAPAPAPSAAPSATTISRAAPPVLPDDGTNAKDPVLAETHTPVCKIASAAPEYGGVDIEQNEASGLGTFDVAYQNAPARHFQVKVVAWPRGCPWVEPMPESPACHGAFLSYQVVFRSYGAGDTKPAGEKLVAGKTVLVRVVQEMGDDGNVVERLEPGDWKPATPIPSMKACTK